MIAMKVVEKVAKVDQSDQIFAKTKKGKEKEHFMQRNVIPPWRPEKLEKDKPNKSYLTKDV